MSTLRAIHLLKNAARVSAWLCASLFTLACASDVRAQATNDARTNDVRGVVVDQNDSPVAGALVTLTDARGLDITGIKADASGRFDFRRGMPYGFTLNVEAEGFGSFKRIWKEGEWGGAELRVVLAPPTLSERVTVTASRTETRLGNTAASVVVLSQDEL